MSFGDGFSQGMGIASAFAKLRNSAILAEEKEEELRISKMSFEDLQGADDRTVGEETALTNIDQARAATNYNVARTEGQNISNAKEEILLSNARNTADLQDTTVNNILLTNTFQVFENLHYGIRDGKIKEGGVVYDMYLSEAEGNMNLLRKDGKIDLLSVLDPAYAEAISSVSGGLEALESGDPNGLDSLLDRPDALNTIFKPKADKFLGKRFIAENGFEPTMGARPLKRLFEDKIKKPLSREILFGKLKHGGIVTVSQQGNKLEFAYEERKQEEGNTYKPG